MARQVSRRGLLLGGAGAAGVAAVAGTTALIAASVEGPAPPPQRVPSPLRAPGARDAVASVEWVRSEARNRSVRLVVATPSGVDRATLPVCVGMHGLGGNAQWFADAGMRRGLGAAWAAGVPPFALVALDGGDNYWHPFRPGDDPMRMLLDELPGWLTARGLARDTGGAPALATGVSMGGAGALMYARARAAQGRPVRAVAAISPGLFTDWRVASRRPFAGEGDWVANDPLRFYPELAGTPTGIWCGDRDSFVDAARRFMALARPEIASVTPGRHEGTYYASVLPGVFAFLGRHSRPTASLAPTGVLPGVLPAARPSALHFG